MIYAPPQVPKFDFQNGLHVERIERQIDPITLRNYYLRTDDVVPLGFFVKGEPYKFWGLVHGDRHFFGVRDWESRQRRGQPRHLLFLGRG